MMTSSNGIIFHVTGTLCGNSPVTGEFPAQRLVTWSFDVSFDLRLNTRLCNQSWGWWNETPSRPLWRHRNDIPCAVPYMMVCFVGDWCANRECININQLWLLHSLAIMFLVYQTNQLSTNKDTDYHTTVPNYSLVYLQRGQLSPITSLLADEVFVASSKYGRSTWWRHQMQTFSALLALCAGNLPVTGEFPAQSPVTRSFDVFFDLRVNKRLSSAHYDVIVMMLNLCSWCKGRYYSVLCDSESC